jgi:hypothetical protein
LPVGVEKIFSFADWDVNHPSDRLPGDRVDSQFDNHANAIAELETRVSRLLRADGKLAHDLLTVESFPPSLHEEMTRRILAEARADRAVADGIFASIKQVRREIEERLVEARTFAAQAAREFAHSLSLAGQMASLHGDLHARVEPLAAAAAKSVATAGLASNVATLTAEASENWAEVSMEWAEHMPDTIPGNILATNAVTGDHWSSRWWANQAATAVGGMLYRYYYGPSSEPPESQPNGEPIQPGSIYFDVEDNIMYVWNGTHWQPFNTPMPAATNSLFYSAAANQTAFPLTVTDLAGRSVTLNPGKQQGIEVFVNGVRLTPTSGAFLTGDFSVNIPTSTITVATPLPAGTIVAVDVLTDPSDLAPAGLITVQKIKKFPFDGVAATFPLLDNLTLAPTVPAGDAAQLKIVVDGVDQEPGADYVLAAAGASVTFTTVPAADAKNFAVYFHG